jgi:hypothetical protein
MQLGNFTYTSVKGVAYIQNVSLHKVIKNSKEMLKMLPILL